MCSTSTRCCIPARSSIIRGMFWRIPRCRFGETRHPCILGIRRIGNRFLPLAAGTGRPQGPRHHRRDSGSLVRIRWRPRNPPGGKPNRLCSTSRALAASREKHHGRIRLPQHVVNRIERRWAARFAKMLAPCRRKRSPSERNDTLRSPKFSAALNQVAVPPRRSLLSRIRWMTYTI